MSFEFQSTLVNVTPNFRISGANIGGVRILYNGDIKVARLVVTNDRDIQFALSGPYEAGDPDVIYNALALSLYELTPGILVNEGAISSIEMTSSEITIDLEGSDLKYAFELDATISAPVELNSHTHKLPTAAFDALSAAAAVWRSSMDGTLEGLATSIATETADRIAADTAIQADVDQNEADADAAIAAEATARDDADQVIIASVANEALARETADTTLQANIDAEAATRAADDTTEANTRSGADAALSARLDVLEADPTTATAVAAGDAATLSSANTYTDGEIATEASARTSADASLSGRLDVLETDPTTATAVAAVQSDVDQNESDSDAADAALSGRLDVLEADPTTATAVAAVQADVDQNESDSDAADAALSARLDTLEADPTTQTEVDTKLDAALVSSYILTLLNDNDAAGARTTLGLGDVATTAVADYATAAQGALADTAVQPAALTAYSLLDGTNIPGPYADDTAAAAGGVAVGALYKHNNGQIHYRVS